MSIRSDRPLPAALTSPSLRTLRRLVPVVVAAGVLAPTFASAAADFTMSVTPAGATVAPGKSAAFTLTLTGSGSKATLSATGLPSGARATFSPSSVTPTATGAASTATISTGSSTPAGTYAVTLTAKGSTTHTASVSLTVSGVVAALHPSALTIAPGQSATTTVTVSAVAAQPPAAKLAVGALPSGVTASLDQMSVTPTPAGTTADLTLAAAAGARTGTTSVKVTATSSGYPAATAVLSLSVATGSSGGTGGGGTGGGGTSTNVATITAPGYDGATLGATYVLTGATTDQYGGLPGLTREEWDVDGKAIDVATSQYDTSYRWDTTTVGYGAHTLTYKTWDTSGAVATTSRPITVGPATIKRVAVILYNFSDQTPPTTAANVTDLTFGSSHSIAGYYREESYGKLQLGGQYNAAGDVFGFYTIPYAEADYSYPNCAFSTWEAAAKQAAINAGVNLLNYDNVVLTADVPGGCGSGYGGATYITAPWNDPTTPDQWIWFAAHELGHSFGLPYHAHSWWCTDANGNPVQVSGSCTSSEYGDPYDVMGSGQLQHMSVFEKGQLGWFGPGQAITVTASGTYTLAPSTQPSSGVQSIRIPRAFDAAGNPTDFYYLEFRQPTSYDVLPQGVVDYDGVQIREAPDYGTTENTGSNLVDATPGSMTKASRDPWDARLPAGGSFVDAAAGITVATVATSSSGATVRVTLP